MNKGIKLASGDIIGILNSDDMYIDSNVIAAVVEEFLKKQPDSVFADLVIVSKENVNKIIRYYDSSPFTPKKLAFGCMPAHSTFFVKRSCYERHGLFDIDYKIAADFELLARFFWRHRISFSYIPKVLIKMRAGGISTRWPSAPSPAMPRQGTGCRRRARRWTPAPIASPPTRRRSHPGLSAPAAGGRGRGLHPAVCPRCGGFRAVVCRSGPGPAR